MTGKSRPQQTPVNRIAMRFPDPDEPLHTCFDDTDANESEAAWKAEQDRFFAHLHEINRARQLPTEADLAWMEKVKQLGDVWWQALLAAQAACPVPRTIGGAHFDDPIDEDDL